MSDNKLNLNNEQISFNICSDIIIKSFKSKRNRKTDCNYISCKNATYTENL